MALNIEALQFYAGYAIIFIVLNLNFPTSFLKPTLMHCQANPDPPRHASVMVRPTLPQVQTYFMDYPLGKVVS